MKRSLLLALVCLCVGGAATAQQRPHYTQYILNNYIINPAVAGIENYTDIKISHRHQWVGLQDAPVTTYLTIHGPLSKSDVDRTTATTVGPSNENPRGRAYWADYTKAEPHHGVGFTMINDRTGPLNRFAAYGTYAYHLGIAERTSISLGVSAGVQNWTLNASKLDFGAASPVDPAVAGSGYLNRLRPDVNAGVWLYSADYFVGLAAQNIIPSKLRFAEDTVRLSDGRIIPHMFLQAGYRMFLNDDFSLLPSVTVRYANPAPIGIDVNAKLQFRELLWAGMSYRHQDGYAAMVGLNVNSTFNIGYAHDFTTSRLNTVSRGTHEIVVGFLLGNRYGDWCPRNLW
ncbi:PorP/SprF family type IX secretion system membrane protein [Aridibaculum aurantiacum]|uniref:PorP/SprF family type IX secretion system membrane protein n=1 Tax=Aridibaculum aurantiacum TaxID=2810307 RepID=UPI001A966CD6|nr:type IX secretion system membrane protein PorP/SprF [Aridibaculum aurantiacum]